MSFQSFSKGFFQHWLLVAVTGSLFLLALQSLFFSSRSLAAEQIVFRYGIFEESLPVKDLRTYAETAKASSQLKHLLGFIGSENQVEVQEFLQTKLPLNIVTLDKLLDTELGKRILSEFATITIRQDNAGFLALRAATILGTRSSGGLGLVSFLEAYPSRQITIDVAQVPSLASFLFSSQSQPKNSNSSSLQNPFNDNLSSSPLWQLAVAYQNIDTQGKQYYGCLFGDSISSGIGNTLGSQIYNFAIPGLSTSSLIAQLKELSPGNVKCKKVIVAIGTNDALYKISDTQFSQQMVENIALVKAFNPQQVILLPAFYSTVAASHNPNLAGPISRVDEINTLIRKIAVQENVPLAESGIQSLYKNHALDESLTIDGVHLNAKGIEIYRQILLKILNSF